MSIVDFAKAVSEIVGNTTLAKKLLVKHKLPNTEEGFVSLCLKVTPTEILDNLFKSRKSLNKLCDEIKIEYVLKEREEIIDEIRQYLIGNRSYVSKIQGNSLSILEAYILRRIVPLDNDSNIYEDVIHCLGEMEQIIKNIYFLYMNKILYDHLNKKDQDMVKKDAKKKGFMLGSAISEIEIFVHKDQNSGGDDYDGRLSKEFLRKTGMPFINQDFINRARAISKSGGIYTQS